MFKTGSVFTFQLDNCNGGVVMNRAVFFDVDGVIRHNNTSKEDGRYYCLKYEDVDYINGVVQAHNYLQRAGYKIFWVTMQNCICERLISFIDCDYILARMADVFSDHGIEIERYEICTSRDETDESKIISKRNAIIDLAKLNYIDVKQSIGIGDRKADIQSYKEAGIGTTIQALNIYGDKKGCADYYYSNNSHISNLDSLFNALMIHHGCNDIPRILSIAKSFQSVKKVWGDEYWMVNSIEGNYCSKILSLIPDHICSLHHHENKCETFTVLSGVVDIESNGCHHIFVRGDSILIQPKDIHRFNAVISPAVLLETSTFHSDEDTFRLEESR